MNNSFCSKAIARNSTVSEIGLLLPEWVISAFFANQIGMRPFLNHSSFVKDDNALHIDDRFPAITASSDA